MKFFYWSYCSLHGIVRASSYDKAKETIIRNLSAKCGSIDDFDLAIYPFNKSILSDFQFLDS